MDGEANLSTDLQVVVESITRGGRATVVVDDGETKWADQVQLGSAKSRKDFLDQVQDRFAGITDEQRQSMADRLINALSAGSGPPASEAECQQEKTAADLLAEMPAEVRAEADEMLNDPMLLKHVIDDVARLGVAGERLLVAAVYLVGTSRLLDKPLAAIIQGPSSSGKSFVVEKTASLFPPEALIHATAMTPQALFHMPEGQLAHRFVVAGERSRVENDDTAEATRALREMLSAGKLSKLMPMKGDAGRIETVAIEQAGPIAYVESTTLTKIFEEDANRCVLLQTDEQPQQTERILRRMAQGCSAGYVNKQAERIIQRHHALQRMLEQRSVLVPYAQRLADLFSTERVEVRRAFPHLLSMIQAVALLHQRQRSRDDQRRVLAGPDDYRIAQRLLGESMSRSLGGGISAAARRFYDRLRTGVGKTFTTADAVGRERDHASGRAVRGWLAELRDAGIVSVLEQNRGSKPTRWQWTGLTPEDCEAQALPQPKQVFPDMASPPSEELQQAELPEDRPENGRVSDKLPAESLLGGTAGT